MKRRIRNPDVAIVTGAQAAIVAMSLVSVVLVAGAGWRLSPSLVYVWFGALAAEAVGAIFAQLTIASRGRQIEVLSRHYSEAMTHAVSAQALVATITEQITLITREAGREDYAPCPFFACGHHAGEWWPVPGLPVEWHGTTARILVCRDHAEMLHARVPRSEDEQ